VCSEFTVTDVIVLQFAETKAGDSPGVADGLVWWGSPMAA